MKHKIFGYTMALVGLLIGSEFVGPQPIAIAADSSKNAADEVPTFRYDPDWPKQLPNGWITGNIGAIHADGNDHIWIIQRPNTTTGLGERDALTGSQECCAPGPPVMEFDLSGKLLQSWGPIHVTDPATKKEVLLENQVSPPYPEGVWPKSEHAIFVDDKNNVWIASFSEPSQVLKLSREGKLLMQIGTQEAKSSNDKANLAGPAGLYVDTKSKEVFIADGYRNRRVIVFDSETGAYKRHWGAYGKQPPDGPQNDSSIYPVTKRAGTAGEKQREQFAGVHCITASKDGLLYVCDRANSRIQVFKKDGTFVREALIQPVDIGIGTVGAMAFSSDPVQRFIYVGDASNKKVHIVRRSDLKVVGSIGSGGRGGGQFITIHTLATDSKGNLYVGESIDNNRVQKFTFTGMRSMTAK